MSGEKVFKERLEKLRVNYRCNIEKYNQALELDIIPEYFFELGQNFVIESIYDDLKNNKTTTIEQLKSDIEYLHCSIDDFPKFNRKKIRDITNESNILTCDCCKSNDFITINKSILQCNSCKELYKA